MAVPSSCSKCQAPLAPSKSGFVFCDNCGTPYLSGDQRSPFEIFGIPAIFKIDKATLESTYYALSRRLHPDRFGGSSSQALFKSQEFSALLNQAYSILRDDEARLDALLKLAGALQDSEKSQTNAQIPASLAEEYFELQDLLMEGGPTAKKAVADFKEKLLDKRDQITAQILALAEKATWAGSEVNKILELRRERSYIRSMLSNLPEA